MIIAGAVLLVLAAIALVVARMQRAESRQATATETMACGDIADLAQGVAAEVGGGDFTQRCEVVGAAGPGPDGLLKAQESGLDAVWTRTEITHKYWVMESSGEDDRRTRSEREETVSNIESTTPFVVADASGTVLVHPDGADVDRPERVVDRFERETAKDAFADGLLRSLLRSGNDSGTIGFRFEEWILRPGAQLYVQGQVSDRGGAIGFVAPTDKGSFLVSTRSEEEIVEGAERNVKIAVAAGAFLALAGLVLLVAGAAA